MYATSRECQYQRDEHQSGISGLEVECAFIEEQIVRLRTELDEHAYELREKQRELQQEQDPEQRLKGYIATLAELDQGRAQCEQTKRIPFNPGTFDYLQTEDEWKEYYYDHHDTDNPWDAIITLERIQLDARHPPFIDEYLTRLRSDVEKRYQDIERTLTYIDYCRRDAILAQLTPYLIPDLARLVMQYVCDGSAGD